ncbi:MAG TPA: hypothetical protein VMI10_22645 [Terriglobales bacterium]|nr:hypothetical protein [Terriglobales bacterium]
MRGFVLGFFLGILELPAGSGLLAWLGFFPAIRRFSAIDTYFEVR